VFETCSSTHQHRILQLSPIACAIIPRPFRLVLVSARYQFPTSSLRLVRISPTRHLVPPLITNATTL